MISIQTKGRVGADGTLNVQVPTELRETDVEVMLVLQRVATHPPTAEQHLNEIFAGHTQ